MHKACAHCGTQFGPGKFPRNFLKQKYCSKDCGHAANHHTPEQVLALFWSRVDKNGPGGCWLWTGYKNERGYGLLSARHKGSRSYRAHRFSWELVHGDTAKGQFCLHKCDVRACVNPDHLFLGTNQDNMDDMRRKGRKALGERTNYTKLTDAQVRDIRARFRTNGKRGKMADNNGRELAAEYGVHLQTLFHIANGRTWAFLK